MPTREEMNSAGAPFVAFARSGAAVKAEWGLDQMAEAVMIEMLQQRDERITELEVICRDKRQQIEELRKELADRQRIIDELRRTNGELAGQLVDPHGVARREAPATIIDVRKVELLDVEWDWSARPSILGAPPLPKGPPPSDGAEPPLDMRLGDPRQDGQIKGKPHMFDISGQCRRCGRDEVGVYMTPGAPAPCMG